MAPQTLQGADRLSEHLNALVLVPDFFHGATMDESWFPPNTDEKKALLNKFLEEKANMGVVDSLIQVRKEVGEKWPGVNDHIGAFGLCFGGMILAPSTLYSFTRRVLESSPLLAWKMADGRCRKDCCSGVRS